MNLTYKARYTNARLPRPVVADVSLHEGGIDITYHDEHNHYKQEKWQKDQVTEAHYSSAIVMLCYKDQQLEVTDRDFITAYRAYAGKRKVTQWLRLPATGTILLLVTGFITLIALGYFVVLPLIADQVAKHFPVAYEIEMGKKIYDNILAESHIDKNRSEAITHFFNNLHVQSEYPVHITVIHDTIVNAYALPGGHIIVYDAIIHTMKTPEELAALLAHEYSHVQLKHTTRNIFRSIGGYLFISALFSDANSLTNLVIDQANQLQNLSYSRELEHEADENGLRILKANNITSRGMTDLFTSLQQASQVQVYEMISTHPDITNRISFVQTFTAENPYTPQPNDSLTYYFNQLKSEW